MAKKKTATKKAKSLTKPNLRTIGGKKFKVSNKPGDAGGDGGGGD